jgi:hypothetical protein
LSSIRHRLCPRKYFPAGLLTSSDHQEGFLSLGAFRTAESDCPKNQTLVAQENSEFRFTRGAVEPKLAADLPETSSKLPAKTESPCGDTLQAGNLACTDFLIFRGKYNFHVIDPVPAEHFVRELTRCPNGIFAYILSLVGNLDATRDIQQETNVVLWRKAGEFKAGSNFMPWALGIARMQVL